MKKVSIIIFLILILCCSIILINSSFYERKIISDTKTENILNTNSLTMMYETDYQSGEYQVSSDSKWPQDGFTFNETLSKCENGSTLIWDDENNKVVMQANVSDKCYVYFDVYIPILFANYIINNVYTGTDGENGLYLHDGSGTYGTLEAGDNSYRYTGANPNNYVCFGSDEATCPNDDLYRIIGVFNEQVKLIKYDYATADKLGNDGVYAGNYQDTFSSTSNYKGNLLLSTIAAYRWSGDSNSWDESNLNIINLNTNYISNIGNEWLNKITNSTWQIGGNAEDNIIDVNAQTAYINEIINPQINITYEAKIGLIYASDYGYAASPENWNTNLSSYNNDTNRNNNWMFMGLDEWILSQDTSNNSSASENLLYLTSSGTFGKSTSYMGMLRFAVRPVFQLDSDVEYISGTGTQSDPYRIN